MNEVMKKEAAMQKTHNVTITLQREWSLTYELELPWPMATGNHAVKHTRFGGHYKTAEAKQYEGLVAAVVLGHGLGPVNRQKPLSGPLAASWLLFPPDRRARDVDNVRKVAADALTRAGFWEDDSNKVLTEEAFAWHEPVKGGKILLTVGVIK